MHSLRGWNRLFVVGGVISCVAGALVPSPTITPPPQLYVGDLELRAIAARQGPDAVSMIEMLLTALPTSLREIAATNIPAVSSILWGEFLDNNKPDWFTKLPQDIQNYLVRQFGPSTAWPKTTPSSSSASSTSQSLNSTSSSSVASSTSSSATTIPTMSEKKEDPSSLTRRQKMGIGIGVGVPLGLLVIGALLFGCCFLCRRRRRRRVEGSEPPSSPGFIPRFSFQDRHHHASEHHAPLNARHYSSQSTNWDDDTGYNAAEWGSIQREGHREDYRDGNHYPAGTAMAMHDSSPVMAPAVFHTHSSNRARGTRTSYTSLRSVAEVTEPDDNITEPAFSDGKGTPPPPHTQSMRRLSQPLHMDVPVMLAAAPVKRKPVSMGSVNSPAAEAASRSLRRPALAKTHHRSSSSSNAVMSNSSSSSGLGYRTENTSPMSPVSDVAPKDVPPKNPFTDDYDYLEDYGPEYSHNGYSQNGYTDLEDGLYGGYKSLDRYPNPSHSRKSSKTEWPLKNVVESTNKRTKSPLWDRVYN